MRTFFSNLWSMTPKGLLRSRSPTAPYISPLSQPSNTLRFGSKPCLFLRNGILEVLCQQAPITRWLQPLPGVHEVRIRSDQNPRRTLLHAAQDLRRRSVRIRSRHTIETRHAFLVQACSGTFARPGMFRDRRAQESRVHAGHAHMGVLEFMVQGFGKSPHGKFAGAI